MVFLVVICCLATVATSQFQAVPTGRQSSTAPKVLYPAAPLHYVNIGPELAGDYQFGYDTGKGPTGQSFREEMRLADGTVKGTYGVIDENGHKRVVHYSAGKSGFIAEEDTNIQNLPFPSIQRQPKLIMPHSFKSHPQQMAIFKPTNYLQSRNSQPLYTAPVPVQQVKADAPLNKLTAAEKSEKPLTSFNRMSAPLQPVDIAVPSYRLPAPAKAEQAVIPPVRSQSVGAMQELMNSANNASAEAYKSLKRVTKKPVIRSKPQRVRKMRKQIEEQAYNPKIEDEYYDSAPAFVDIERLSYNIGTDRSSAAV